MRWYGFGFIDGKVVVMGVIGGVGLMVIMLFFKFGFDVVVVIGKFDWGNWLWDLGVKEIVD